MDEQEFKEGDLMPWHDMTRAIKNLQVFNDEHTERLQQLEKEIGRMSFLSYDLGEQSKLIASCMEKIKGLEEILKSYFNEFPSKRIAELEARVDSLTRTLDFVQQDIGIEVVVTPENIGELYDESNLRL